MANWRLKIWEVGRKEPITTEHHGDLTRQQVIDFFGCNQPDVVKYEVTEL